MAQLPPTKNVNVTSKTVSLKFPAQWRKCGDCGRDVLVGEKLFYTRKGKNIALVQCAGCAVNLIVAMTDLLDKQA